jgi:diguanylate cyclase (GGDEF)-like protein
MPVINDYPSLVFLTGVYAWSYLLVFIYIYKHKVSTLVMIMALSLTHTLLVNGLIYHIHMILFDEFQRPSFILIQVSIFIITTPLIIAIMKKTIKNIIDDFNRQLHKMSVVLPFINFLLLFLLRFYINFNGLILLFVFYALMISMMILTYYVIYKLVSDHINIHQLSTIAYRDSLTGLKNRLALFHDFDQMVIKDLDELHLYYIDLDKLKSINDQYGHLEGDEYIIRFAQACKQAIHKNDDLYRISGDEFIILSERSDMSINKIKDYINKYFLYKHDFFGVSIGKTTYPTQAQTLDELLNLADRKMYEDKSNQKNRP